MNASEKLNSLLSYFGTNKNKLGTLIKKRQSLYDIENGKIKSFSPELVKKIKEIYPTINEDFFLFDADNLIVSGRSQMSNDNFISHMPEPVPNINPTTKDVELSLKKILKNKGRKELSNAKLNINTEKLKLVKLIPEKAAMGLVTHFFDNEYVEQLETELIEVDEYFSEDAYKVDSVGESMNDGTARALLDGDKFLAKDIPRHKWGERLINGGKNLFYILHNERGNLIKEIVSHNIDTKELILHSWNEDKKEFPDFKIKTNECYIIASIEKLLDRNMK